ncbi:uncharacterized protein PADG_03631 [Paracoccidioides brasiliensis Pb18]|uniref:Phosphoglycerate mutase n=1 Tax=Paracoccidioides brasiliensis (strain Pb18) TaxID=502780 RepID=C1G8P5_PARBD|nr:uncharacterized protein PADG_03631 [Paracoccidioides brasiliensis Pb18]EEH47547.2 hypothetical protein PADG_03631 [Paracoccidioides brasiliensis Pb18]
MRRFALICFLDQFLYPFFTPAYRVPQLNNPKSQGYHNLAYANHTLSDPLLTPHGESQCKDLSAEFPHHAQIDLIVASPLRRTLYTALLAFEDQIKSRGLKIIALPEIQETSDVPCDVGSDLELLEKEVTEKGLPVDLKLVGEGWNSKTGKWAPTAEAIEDRAREARRWLKSRPEKEIVIVSHGGFLHYFTEDWQDSTLYQVTKRKPSPNNYTNVRPSPTYPGTGWRNTEYRTYTFSDLVHQDDLYGRPLGGDNATIQETPESRLRRGKSPEVPPRALRKQFFIQAMKGWENQVLDWAKQEETKTGTTAGIEARSGDKVVRGEDWEEESVYA